MINIVPVGFAAARKELARQEKQIPFATALALTRTAQIAERAIKQEMESVFDRPTRWTLNSLRLIPAKKTKLQARVDLKDEAAKGVPAARWLNPEIKGGPRQDKRSEKLLRARGILPNDKYIAPAKSMRLDKSGNVRLGQMQKILSGLGAQFDRYQNSTDSARSAANKRKFFVMYQGDKPLGIAERTSRRNIKLLLAFVSRPTYSKRLDFYGIGDRVAVKNLPIEMRKAFEQAIRTAR
ncbi:hypothetical protein SAMN05216421_1101 [Halopseudomonas xinjiangensis]|uniref:Uncharacterized protein n=1 Tax=Halopseudomonas xinjiangensis TaxID=487184 RepID=A0A1H1QD97_9GAMM|nr:hypothetical protein [Halopseudomonas xinjiangensis]SDS20839.1 hypothetical protein SAMN05216421_1101 [Halopseudomonas xinjiangensis]